MRLRSVLLLAVLALSVPAASHAAEGDANVVRAFYERVLGGATAPDLAQRAAAVLAPDWRTFGNNDASDDLAHFVGRVQGFGQAIPDLRFEIVEIVVAGDRYVVRSRATGTPAQPFFGVAPSGRSFNIMTIDVHTVRDGRIVRSYHVEDWAGALRQLRGQ